MLAVERLAKKNLVTARPDESVRLVVRRMAEQRVGAVLVLENGDLHGIFSERDALKRVLANGLDPASTPVSEVCTPDPVTVRLDSPIKECVQKAKERRIRHLPVVDENGTAVGIVSVRDFLRVLINELEGMIDSLRDDQRAEELTDPYGLLQK
jgi:CBS domain-containing protein